MLCNVKERKKFTRLLQNKFNALDYSTLFVLTCHVLTNMVRVIENDLNGNENCIELTGGSSYREFEVTEGKITVNV